MRIQLIPYENKIRPIEFIDSALLRLTIIFSSPNIHYIHRSFYYFKSCLCFDISAFWIFTFAILFLRSKINRFISTELFEIVSMIKTISYSLYDINKMAVKFKLTVPVEQDNILLLHHKNLSDIV